MSLNTHILVGSKAMHTDYVNSFTDQNNLKPYNSITFEKKIKVGDIRELKKQLTTKYNAEEKRLVVFSEEITREAQNALLKTIEELVENVYFFICVTSLESLLPTILSRAKIIQGKNLIENGKYISEVTQFLEEYPQRQQLSVLQFIDRIEIKTQNDFDDLVLSFRSVVLQNIEHNTKHESTIFGISILSSIQEYYALIKQNNINKKLFLEATLLSYSL